jgi:paraquat-inducible protein B
VFWIERPEVGLDNITGLRTVITGPEIQIRPGQGASETEFTGLDSAPVAFEVEGLKIILRAGHLESIRQNSPIYYRGVEVGIVQDVALNSNATAADVHALIQQRYTKLVRDNSVFWDVSGASLHAGLFSGINFKMESLRTLATGGIDFATPNVPGRLAKADTVFPLYAGAPKGASGWAPQIALSAEK